MMLSRRSCSSSAAAPLLRRPRQRRLLLSPPFATFVVAVAVVALLLIGSAAPSVAGPSLLLFLRPPPSGTSSSPPRMSAAANYRRRRIGRCSDGEIRLAAATKNGLPDSGADAAGVDLELLKKELLEYLDKRNEVGADELAKAEVGKTVGGTRGNPVLEYVSLSPNKGSTVTAAPNAFDYTELEKYGYARLATPIMKAGGRLAMYELLGMEKPVPEFRKRRNPSAAAAGPIKIDRTGETDSARYSGLKLGLLQNDEVQALALQEAQRKIREGELLRPRLQEEEYVQPFKDHPNVSRRPSSSTSSSRPQQPKPDGYTWTAERLDEWGKRRGRTLAEMEREQLESVVLDGMETTELDLVQRVYSIATGLVVATAFGRATPAFLSQVLSLYPSPQDTAGLLDALKAPAAALLLASIGSCAACAVQAPEKQRNPVVWAVKGLMGGPFAVRQLRELPRLLTGRELLEQQQQQQQRGGAET